MIESSLKINQAEEWLDTSVKTIKSNQPSLQSKIYLLNLGLNLKLTSFHVYKTLERLMIAVYYWAASVFSALGVVISLGRIKDLNKFHVNQCVEFGLHMGATIYSSALTIGNILAGLEGLLSFGVLTRPISTESSLEHESQLIHKQRNLDEFIITIENYHACHGIFKLLSGKVHR